MDIFSIGEMVIDFLPGTEPGSYLRNAGGAPANMAIAAARNGMDAGFCGMLGDDAFGRFLAATLEENGVRLLCGRRTAEAVTTMAFVTLESDGERSFTFARKPGADMLLTSADVREKDLTDATVIHAGSCSLSGASSADATLYALRRGSELKKLISFDVNYRALLWDGGEQAAVKRIREALPYVSLLKVSEEETPLLGGDIPALMREYGIPLVVETLGSQGARAFFQGSVLYASCPEVPRVDTTGAGDAFWGTFLAGLLLKGVGQTHALNEDAITRALREGNAAGTLCVQKKGAISALPYRAEIEELLERGDFS
ncbi:MAG: carbohydrate kinase [Oscillospiraceae bacterium]|jgi:sugar/nucleoside kinase (ribokinase family)|nr:carbohydrate kinase [Oscillospiraceae bacterium]